MSGWGLPKTSFLCVFQERQTDRLFHNFGASKSADDVPDDIKSPDFEALKFEKGRSGTEGF